MNCQEGGLVFYFRLHPEAALFQPPQQSLQRAFLPPHLESSHFRAVEQRDGEEQRRERFALAALFVEERFHSLREVTEVPEAERLREIGQGTGAGNGRSEGESHVG